MPVRDCMSGSPYCPANKESKFAMPGYEPTGCDSCVEEGLKKDEIPKCFFCKLEVEDPLDSVDLTFTGFANRVMNMKHKAR